MEFRISILIAFMPLIGFGQITDSTVSSSIRVYLESCLEVDAGEDTSYCANLTPSILGTATGQDSVRWWSDEYYFGDSTSLTPTLTKLDTSDHYDTLMLSAYALDDSVVDYRTVYLVPVPRVYAGPDSIIDDEESNFSPLEDSIWARNFTDAWWSTPDGSGSFDNINAFPFTYTIHADDRTAGSVTFVVHASNTGCVAVTDTMVLTIEAAGEGEGVPVPMWTLTNTDSTETWNRNLSINGTLAADTVSAWADTSGNDAHGAAGFGPAYSGDTLIIDGDNSEYLDYAVSNIDSGSFFMIIRFDDMSDDGAIIFEDDSGQPVGQQRNTPLFRAYAGSFLENSDVTEGTWHTITVHHADPPTNSYIKVDDNESVTGDLGSLDWDDGIRLGDDGGSGADISILEFIITNLQYSVSIDSVHNYLMDVAP